MLDVVVEFRISLVEKNSSADRCLFSLANGGDFGIGAFGAFGWLLKFSLFPFAITRLAADGGSRNRIAAVGIGHPTKSAADFPDGFEVFVRLHRRVVRLLIRGRRRLDHP